MKTKYSFPVILLSVLILFSCGHADYSAGAPVNSGPLIEGFAGSDYGYAVYDIEEEKLVMDHNIDSVFIPASVTKLFTALFALDILGEDHEFKTEILCTGPIKDGIIHGDLYIRGSGDPELTVADLSGLARKLRAKGIRGITGSFCYDESIFPGEESLDPTMPLYAPYNSGIGALNLNRNTVQLVRRKVKNSENFTYEFLPPATSITFSVYSEKGVFPFVSWNFTSGKEVWNVPAKKVLDTRHPLPVKKTALFTAWTFHRLCAINGIKLGSPVPGTAPRGSDELCTHKSRRLHDIIPDMLKNSDNLTAEIISRASLARYNKGGSPVTFSQAVASYFSERFSSVQWNGFTLKNGSGLSSSGRITPGETIAVLMALGDDYEHEDILPMSGENGTLRHRLDSRDTAYRIYAKTGSIYYSSSLAGVVYGATGKRYLFALFIDGKEQRGGYDLKTVKEINDSTVAEKWSKKASDAVDSFMAGIIPML